MRNKHHRRQKRAELSAQAPASVVDETRLTLTSSESKSEPENLRSTTDPGNPPSEETDETASPVEDQANVRRIDGLDRRRERSSRRRVRISIRAAGERNVMRKTMKTNRRHHPSPPSANMRGIQMMRASDVKPQQVVSLWGGRFYRGKVSLIAGEPGLGKSQIAAYIAATVSTGGDWPFGEGAARRGDVIYVSAEDSAAETIRPRLEAAGADLDRVHIVERVNDPFGPRPFSLVDDMVLLEQALQEVRKPRLVIVDPVNACLSSTDFRPFNASNVSQVRALVCRLEALATRHRVAIVCVTHFTKAKGTALFRITGSFAFVAAARSVLTVTRKPDESDRRVLAPAKNNLASEGNAIAFRIEQRLTSDNILAPCVAFVSPLEAI
jgi:AAA domain